MIDAESAVRLTAERAQAHHPEWRPAQVWLEALRAMHGDGEFAGFYALLRSDGTGESEVSP